MHDLTLPHFPTGKSRLHPFREIVPQDTDLG